MELKGTTAVITGSSGRLGSAIVTALAQAGCNCICHYHKNKQKAQILCNKIESSQVRAIAVGADLTKPDRIDYLFEKAAQLGTPRILINSAAFFSRQPLGQVTFDDSQRVLALNLTAAILTSKAFAEGIKTKYAGSQEVIGKIINISDVGGVRPWAEYVVYCSSKAALIGATKALAKELAPVVCVNSVAPGVVGRPDDTKKGEKKRQLAFIPMAKFAEPKDVTDAIIFLLKNDYVTGQVINIDGGRCITSD